MTELQKFLHIKGYAEWQVYLMRCAGKIRERLRENDEQALNSLMEVKEGWSALSIERKIEQFFPIMEIGAELGRDGILKLGALRLFNSGDWNAFIARPDVKTEYNFTYEYEGMFAFYTQHGNEHPAIILNNGFLNKNDFWQTLHLFGHELGHAVLETNYRQFHDNIEYYLNAQIEEWRDCAAHPLYMNMIIKHGETYGHLLTGKQEMLDALALENTQENYEKYMEIYDERLVEDFAAMLVRTLRDMSKTQ